MKRSDVLYQERQAEAIERVDAVLLNLALTGRQYPSHSLWPYIPARMYFYETDIFRYRKNKRLRPKKVPPYLFLSCDDDAEYNPEVRAVTDHIARRIEELFETDDRNNWVTEQTWYSKLLVRSLL